MFKKAFPALIVVLVLIVGTTISASAVPQPSAPTQAEDEIVVHQNPNAGREVLSWSADALDNAQPMPLGILDGAPEQNKLVQLSSGTRHTSQPMRPNLQSSAVDTTDDTSILINTGYEQPYPPRYTGFPYFGRGDLYPTITYGVLFFTQNSTAYRCSATLVYRNVIFTAGHCVHDGSNSDTGWSSNFEFYPAYRNGANPWYTPNVYTNWVNSYVPSQWYSSEQYGVDFGAIVFDDSTGAFPGDTYGWTGFQTGFSEVQNWAVFGYPAEPPFGGKQVSACLSNYSRIDSTVLPASVGFGCNMTGGSSGGALIRRYSVGGGAVNGVISYTYLAYPNEMYSSYFGDTAWNIYCAAAESDMDPTPAEYRLDHPNCP